MRNPLGRESLDILDCVVRSVVEELTDQMEPFVVGYVGRRFLVERFAVEVLRSLELRFSRCSEPHMAEIGFDNLRRDCGGDGDSIEGHDVS
jgi:hypothetical protein